MKNLKILPHLFIAHSRTQLNDWATRHGIHAHNGLTYFVNGQSNLPVLHPFVLVYLPQWAQSPFWKESQELSTFLRSRACAVYYADIGTNVPVVLSGRIIEWTFKVELEGRRN